MKIYLKEKIGNPQLFTGRKQEMQFFLKWIDNIKIEVSKSSAILSRRKTGKSALLQRLYNITFDKNDKVVPFYYEIEESSQWILNFSIDFLISFIYQYIAFKTRKIKYLYIDTKTLESAYDFANKEGLNYLSGTIESALSYRDNENIDLLWKTAREAPRIIAEYANERVVQIIDEFQHINRYIYRDRACKNIMDDLAGSYLHTVEYKNAPMLLSGSWVGWLTKDLNSMLPGRVIHNELEDMPAEEAIEMILKYSHILKEPVTYETALIMAHLTEGSPFYISSLFESNFYGKDFTTEKGVIDTLEYETTNRKGSIFKTWMEYIDYAIDKINDVNGKKIILYLSKNRDREVGRDELMNNLKLEMTDSELQKKLHALVYSDIIENGRSNFYYQGVKDNIFDKVFRSRYADDIEKFDHKIITDEYKKMYEDIKKKGFSIKGELNYYKGKFAEFMIINRLRYMDEDHQDSFKTMMENLPEDFRFERYESVWSYKAAPVNKSDIEIDIFAKTDHGVSLIGEVKNRKDRKFSKEEVIEFENKAKELIMLENIEKAVLFVFSLAGFTDAACSYMKQVKIAWTQDQRWLSGENF